MRSFLDHVLPDGYRITVASSGGADSLALALATLRVAGPDRVGAVTVDHQLQAGSAARAIATAAQLRELGYSDVRIRTVTVGSAGGPEAAAREARYQALDPGPGVRRAVLLGHTRDDQAETVLLGLARGSGPRSLAGMSPWRPPWGRPLLDVRRRDTENHCRAAGLAWWSDPHNADPRFTRVRLRREVLPLLDEVLGGGVGPALARSAELIRADLRALDEIAGQVRRQAGGSGPGLELDLTTLVGHPAAIRRRVLRLWAAEAGSRALTADHLARLDALCLGENGAGAVRLPGAVDAVRRRRVLLARAVDGSDPGWQAEGGRPRPVEASAISAVRPRSQRRRRPVAGTAAPESSALITSLTSADAVLPGPQDPDPGAAHGYPGEIAATLITAEALHAKIVALAAAVAADHTNDRPPLLVCVLKGAVMFVTDFARALPIPSELEFMAVSSYGSATSSSGVVRILKDLDRDITGRRVVIVEDIIDSGLTLSWLLKNLASRGPAAIDIVALLRKPEAVKVDVAVRYVGFDIPTEFVVGYGLDYNERYRDLPFVGTLGEHMYT